MKKLSVIILSVTIVTLSVFFASAKSIINFKLSDTEVNQNRLFTLEMTANSDKKLSAATFEFTFDSSVMEFRDITAERGSKVKYNDKGGVVKVSFLNSSGLELNNRGALFEIKFKAISSGSAFIEYTVQDCVDSDVKSMDIGTVESGSINILSKETSGNNSESSKNTNKKSGNSSSNSISKSAPSKNSSSGKKSDSGSDSSESEESEKASDNNLGKLNNVVIEKDNHLFTGIVLGASVIGTITLIYIIVEHIRIKKGKKKSIDKD